jgi:GH15 family glucan-1,4-alpha-glucosidase
MPSRIEEYALIGDCETAALVGRDGSIDWLCFPRFDSGACFAALLGTPEHGRWQLAPAENIRHVRRRYREGTLILETEYETESGVVTLIDWMPLRTATPDVIRLVVGKRGQVRMRMELVIRFDYGRIVPWVRRTDRGLRAVAGPDTLYCRTDIELRGEDLRTVADFTIAGGSAFRSISCGRRRIGQSRQESKQNRACMIRKPGGAPGPTAVPTRANGGKRSSAR